MIEHSRKMPQSHRERSGVSPHLAKVGIIVNPRSGAGRALHMAEQAQHYLAQCGLSVEVRESEKNYQQAELVSFMRSMDAVIVSGGDGTVMALLSALAESKTPFYMLPAGNESLLARNFKMQGDTDSLALSLAQWRIEDHYYGLVNEAPFFSMASVGLDSEIIATIDSYRTGPIGHLGYILPTLRVARSYEPPAVTLLVDGAEVLKNAPGYLIVANTPEYALRINPVPEARSDLPLLHARFFPGYGLIDAAKWMINACCGHSIDLEKSISFQGRRFEVSVNKPKRYPIQADGDLVAHTPAEISVSDKQVRVIRGIERI